MITLAKFRINITEQYSKIIEIEADNEDEAHEKAEKQYLSGNIDMRSNVSDDYKIEVKGGN